MIERIAFYDRLDRPAGYVQAAPHDTIWHWYCTQCSNHYGNALLPKLAAEAFLTHYEAEH